MPSFHKELNPRDLTISQQRLPSLWFHSNTVRFLRMRFSGVLLHHHLDRDFAHSTKFVTGVNAQRLMSNPVLDRAQQRRSHLVGEERMLLLAIHGRPRNARKPIAVVCQNARANGDAFVTDISPRIITGARNELRNRVLRFAAKRAAEAARLCISLPHLYISNLENTVVLDRSSCRQHASKLRSD
jgi:hypothetical protein